MRLFAALVIILIVVLILAGVYFFIENINLNRLLDQLDKKNKNEFKKDIEAMKIQISKDISEKYKLDFTAFEKLAEEVKAERKKIKGLTGEDLRIKK